jgi:porin
MGGLLERWQYVYTKDTDAEGPINLLNGQPDQQGLGLFARFGFADKETNPVEWAISGGVGGRGLIPSRDNDNFGIGYYGAFHQRDRRGKFSPGL